MKHRIVILGAGYAGAAAAGYLARHLHPSDVEITVINADADFTERIRLHQLAAGHDPRRFPLAEMFAGTDIVLRVGQVAAVDVGAHTVELSDGDSVAYDSLLYTLGSATDRSVDGVAEHAYDVAIRESAQRLRERLDELGEAGNVLVVGGNLTAIEAATEFAEARPGLHVTLVTRGELGGWLGAKARTHLLCTVDRLGIELHEGTTIDRVTATGALADDGTVYLADATVWAAGFAVDPIAATSGLEVADNGRIVVDRMMRSVSHPEVYAAGDAVYVIGENGRELPMSCGSAGFTRMQATATIVGDLTGAKIDRTSLPYLGNCISLGQRDAIVQMVDGEGTAKSWSLRGRPAARFKAFVLSGAVWSVANPTYGLPVRRRRLASSKQQSPESVDA